MGLRKRCFVSGCYVKDNNENEHRISYFNVPKASLQAWQDLIKKPGLTVSSRLCSRHFDDTDIVKGRVIQNIFYPYQVWRLSAGAMPKHFLGKNTSGDKNSKARLSGKNTAKPKSPSTPVDKATTNVSADSNKVVQDSIILAIPHHTLLPKSSDLVPQNAPADQPVTIPLNSTPLTSLVPHQLTNSASSRPCITAPTKLLSNPVLLITPDNVLSTVTDNIEPAPQSCIPTTPENHTVAAKAVVNFCLNLSAVDFAELIRGVKLPSCGWVWSFDEQTKNAFCSNHEFSDGKLMIKSVQILNKNQALFYINGKSISTSDLICQFQNHEELSDILVTFHSRIPCVGIENQSLENIEVSDRCLGVKEGNVWRSKQCVVFAEKKNLCSKCQNLKVYLLKKKRLPPKDPMIRKRKLRTCQKMIQRLTRRQEEMLAVIESCRKEKLKLMRDMKANGFDTKVKRFNEKEQMIVKAMLAKAEARLGRNNNVNGIRYEPAFLQECLTIRSKSSTVYRYLRNNGILPLPSMTTLDRLRRIASSNAITTADVTEGQSELIHSENERELSPSPIMTVEIISTE